MLRNHGSSWYGFARRLVHLAVAAALLIACSDENEPGSPVPVATVAVWPEARELGLGQTLQLKAAALAANGDTLKDRSITWRSNLESVATVSSAGVVTAHAGGIAVIEAVSENRLGTAMITVTNPAPAVTGLAPATLQSGTGAFQLTVTGANFVAGSVVHWNGEARPTTFVSGTELRAQISAPDIEVSRTVQVSVRAPLPGGGISNQAPFIITPGAAEITRIVVTPGTQNLWLGETVQMTATAYDALNRPIPNPGPVVWTTSNTTVLMVSAAGLVTATGDGSSTIEANIAGRRGSTTAQVWTMQNTYDVVYESSDGGPPTLFVVSPGTFTPRRRLLPPGMSGRQPAVSSDGTRVAFVGIDAQGNRDIYVVDRDGGNLRRLTTHPARDEYPAWSADGTKIAFESLRDGIRDIFVINADGTGEFNLTGSQLRFGIPSHSRPSWSPDGATVVFSWRELSIQPAEGRIAMINADGTNLRVMNGIRGYHDLEPSYSRDGTMIAFRKFHAEYGDQIVIMRPNGDLLYYLYPPGHGLTPKWSPNGQWLTFVSGEDQSQPTDIYVWKVGEFGRKRISDANGGESPAWIRR